MSCMTCVFYFIFRASVQTAVSIISPEFDDPDQLLDQLNHANNNNPSEAGGMRGGSGHNPHPPAPPGAMGHPEPMGAIVEDPDADGKSSAFSALNSSINKFC